MRDGQIAERTRAAWPSPPTPEQIADDDCPEATMVGMMPMLQIGRSICRSAPCGEVREPRGPQASVATGGGEKEQDRAACEGGGEVRRTDGGSAL